MQDIDDQALNRANIILFLAYFLLLLYHSIITKHTLWYDNGREDR